jgi:cyclin-dependent kinase 12/13
MTITVTRSLMRMCCKQSCDSLCTVRLVYSFVCSRLLLTLLSFVCWCNCTTDGSEIPKNVFMVFEYLEYDLTGILETPEIRFTQDHIKSWSQQLLQGVHYMHTNKVIHRDLKSSNLLVSKSGELKIADWGLARSWNSEMKRLTNKVITLWYRPPELLLGMMEYSPKIDMWSVGCIIAEMFRRSGFLKGSTEASQLELIFNTVGHPTDADWPDGKQTCRLWEKFLPQSGDPRLPNRISDCLRTNLPNPKWMTGNAVDLISNLMILNPSNRWSAEHALDSEYFFESPIVKTADKLSMEFSVKTVHEWECRRKFERLQAANGSRPPPPAAASPPSDVKAPPPRG